MLKKEINKILKEVEKISGEKVTPESRFEDLKNWDVDSMFVFREFFEDNFDVIVSIREMEELLSEDIQKVINWKDELDEYFDV